MSSNYKLDWKTRWLNKILNAFKPIEQMSLDELKTFAQSPIPPVMQRILAGKQIKVNRIVEQEIGGRHGKIPLRLYYASDRQSQPLIVFFHGGGWVYGNFNTYDRLCRRLAKNTDAIVLTVDYRLAPFYKYPTALEDCYDALLWAVQNAVNLSADPQKIMVMGDSAGGNLATAVCLMARNLGQPSIAQQVLIYPVVSGELNQPSTKINSDAPVLTTSRMQYFVDCYAQDRTDVLQPYFSPLLEEDLSQLPPALIIIAEYDPLHDQGQMYAERLQAANVGVKLLDYATIHGFISFPVFCDRATLAIKEIAQYVKQ